MAKNEKEANTLNMDFSDRHKPTKLHSKEKRKKRKTPFFSVSCTQTASNITA